MFAGLLLLLAGSVAASNFNQTYTTSQTVMASTSFRSCTFENCGSSNDGGALYLNNESLSLSILNCVFIRCQSGASGGAVKVDACLWCAMNGTSGRTCVAGGTNAFCSIAVRDSSPGTLTVSESAAVSCTGAGGTLRLGGPETSGGSPSYIGSLNSTANVATSHSSGLFADDFVSLSVHFCTFLRNTAHNCLLFDRHIGTNDISCVGLFGNSCSSSGDYPGLVYVGSTLTLSNCVFLANSFDAFLGGLSSGNRTTTFNRCVFDFTSINTTNSVSFTTTMCTYAPSAALAVTFGGCPWPDPTETGTRSQTPTENESPSLTGTSSQTPSRSASRTPTETRSQSPTRVEAGGQTGGPLGTWALVGIAAGALVLIIAVSLAVWGVRRGRADSATSSMPAEMTESSLKTTEDIDFAARTYDAVTMADGTVTSLNLVDPDESVAPARNLVEDFL
jgi:hypothetical protein